MVQLRAGSALIDLVDIEQGDGALPAGTETASPGFAA
jgi:hypothetical protein